MKLLIDIPKEFEQHFQADRFEDSLHRLSTDAHLLAGLYEQETALMLSEAFKNAIPVPKHGRLIDADVLDGIMVEQSGEEYNHHHAPRTWERALSCFRDYIKDAPTIIPASEEAQTGPYDLLYEEGGYNSNGV